MDWVKTKLNREKRSFKNKTSPLPGQMQGTKIVLFKLSLSFLWSVKDSRQAPNYSR